MADEAPTKFLVVVRLHPASDLQRIGNDFPRMMEVLRRFATTEPELAFMSKDGLLFGHFIISSAPTTVIRAEWEKCEGSVTDDAMMLFEIGAKHGGTAGFSRAWTWLQRH